MSGLVLSLVGRPLKPAPKISGENRRRFYSEAIRRREKRNSLSGEHAGEIPSLAKTPLLANGILLRE
jgi:hypothetical protein